MSDGCWYVPCPEGIKGYYCATSCGGFLYNERNIPTFECKPSFCLCFANSGTYPGFLSLFLRKKSNPKSRPKTITAVFGTSLIKR